jgi:hypothetical protein
LINRTPIRDKVYQAKNQAIADGVETATMAAARQ